MIIYAWLELFPLGLLIGVLLGYILVKIPWKKILAWPAAWFLVGLMEASARLYVFFESTWFWNRYQELAGISYQVQKWGGLKSPWRQVK